MRHVGIPGHMVCTYFIKFHQSVYIFCRYFLRFYTFLRPYFIRGAAHVYVLGAYQPLRAYAVRILLASWRTFFVSFVRLTIVLSPHPHISLYWRWALTSLSPFGRSLCMESNLICCAHLVKNHPSPRFSPRIEDSGGQLAYRRSR